LNSPTGELALKLLPDGRYLMPYTPPILKSPTNAPDGEFVVNAESS